MKYERLTERDRYWKDEELWTQSQEPIVEEIDEIYNRLADLEDKIENGTLIFKEEKKKYYVVVGYWNCQGQWDYKISYTSIEYEKENNQVVLWADGILLVTRKNWLFDTKAEAEKRLEELRGEV